MKEQIVDTVEGVPVVRYSMYMTGKKLRRHLGIDNSRDRVYADRSYRVCAKFRGIKKDKRLRYLIKMSKVIRESRTLQELQALRCNFNAHKVSSLPLSETAQCYCCTSRAVLRHHVITLANGGRNKRNNIVPLCNSCHCKVHPHLATGSKSKRAAASRHSVQPKDNGPFVPLQTGEKIVFVPAGA